MVLSQTSNDSLYPISLRSLATLPAMVIKMHVGCRVDSFVVSSYVKHGFSQEASRRPFPFEMTYYYSMVCV